MPALAVKCGLFLNEDNHFAYPCNSEEWREIRAGIPTHGCWLRSGWMGSVQRWEDVCLFSLNVTDQASVGRAAEQE
jgi:hypothetical protein